MRSNTKTNMLIRNVVILGDFLLLNGLFYAYVSSDLGAGMLMGNSPVQLAMIASLSLAIAEYYFSTLIHQRMVTAEHVFRQVTQLVVLQCVLTYLITKTSYLLLHLHSPHSLFTLYFTYIFYPSIVALRYTERWAIKRYRRLGGNTRTAMLIGSDTALFPVCKFLTLDPTVGYRVLGYYANHELGYYEGDNWQDYRKEQLGSLPIPEHLGTLADLKAAIDADADRKVENADTAKKTPAMPIPDEIYCSLSWSRRDDIRRIRKFCDRNVIHFYFVPVYAESFGQTLKIEQIGDTVGYTNYVDPLQLPTNQLIKRVFDIVFSGFFLLCTLPLLPVIALIIKIQSPGPLLFKQLRTGMNGQNFVCYKFRSMHVNKDADRLQATKDDPRKFPFGNFMRKANIDELPQFWNVLKGDMSIVGPRPHMLAHTEQYSQLIDKYMVRHFVKPGVTGWAQVTGFRGETQELWQMEGRVKRDIWYIENWSIWLDIRIIWLTARQLFVHDKLAY